MLYAMLPDMAQVKKIMLSTTDQIPGVNRTITYGGMAVVSGHKNIESALDALEGDCRRSDWDGVVGIRFVPVMDVDGGSPGRTYTTVRWTAYGTYVGFD